MNQLAINTVGNDLELSAAFCRTEKVGIEVTDFAFPSNLDGNLRQIIDRHIKAVEGISPVTFHGPFFDLNVVSRDPEIVAVARKRHSTALKAAAEIGATLYITHTNFTPIITDPSYRKNWPGRTLDFWLPMADKAGKSGIVICLENLWEPTPDTQAELITIGNHPHLRPCLDNGHTLVFSNVPSSQWVRTLGELLVHCHLHDNSGKTDEHKPIGEGKEDWPALMAAIRKYAPDAVLVAESDSLAGNKKSLARLRDLHIT